MSTKYPAQIDNSITLPVVNDNLTAVNADSVNRLRQAIIAIETELGVNPSASYSTLRSRIDYITNLIEGVDNGIQMAGDLGGTKSIPKVIGLQGYAISNLSPNTNQILSWNGITWAPNYIYDLIELGSIITIGGNVGSIMVKSSDTELSALTGEGGILPDLSVPIYRNGEWLAEEALEVPVGIEGDYIVLNNSGGLKVGTPPITEITGSPYSVVVFDGYGDQSEVSNFLINTNFHIPVPIGGGGAPLQFRSTVIHIENDALIYELTSSERENPRLHVACDSISENFKVSWTASNTLGFLGLVTVYGSSSIVTFVTAPGDSVGAAVQAGETVWLAYNGTQLVRADGYAVFATPPDSDPSSINPNSLAMTGLWGFGYTGSPLIGQASIGTSGLHDATTGLTAPTVGSLNSLPTMICNGLSSRLDPDGALSDYIAVDENFSFFILFNMNSATTASGVPIADPAFFSETAGALSFHYSSEGFVGFMQTVSGPKAVALPCPINEWHIAFATYDGATFSIGLDGPPNPAITSSTISAPPPTNIEAPYRTGLQLFRNYNESKWIDGEVARIGFIDRVLTSDEMNGIAAYYNDLFGLNME